MKRVQFKTIDFTTKLRRTVLFCDNDVEAIAFECGSDKTVPGIMDACDKLNIALNAAGLAQLCQTDFSKGVKLWNQ